MIRFDDSRALPFIDDKRRDDVRKRAMIAQRALLDGSGAGNAFLGWRELLLSPQRNMLSRVQEVARRVRENADVLICVGIGGSYLGAEAVLQALRPGAGAGPEIHFAGHHLGSAYLNQLLDGLEGKSVYVNVISKSGTTLEPAVAFRLIRTWMTERYDDVDARTIITTDPDKGALNAMRERHGFEKFEIPPSVGGRFSVLTPVGLLPVAVAGVDIESLVDGATRTAHEYAASPDNPAVEYATFRNALFDDGYAIEILAAFEPRLFGIQAWWQQLFGESEGKEGEGLYPDAVNYTSDLHSLGQFVQEGQRILAETFLCVEQDDAPVHVPAAEDDADGLGYLVGKTLHEINEKAYEGTAEAHQSGGVPNATVWMDRVSPATLGELIYFFEHAVAVSGYVLGVNPFDQPGVEAYKKNMFRLLGRP